MPRWKTVAGALAVALLATFLAIRLGLSGPHQASEPRPFSFLSFTVIAQADQASTPTVSSAQANTTAFRALNSSASRMTNYRLRGESLMSQVSRVSDPAGRVWFKTQPPETVWMLVFTAPAQKGFQYVTALVLVDAQSGAISVYQVRASNSQADALPLPKSSR